ncbi:hypothetical protein GCM10007977_030340 [Dactylosporangium sucinum]|uniref:Uncharacterized protein n=1 Tax=Dactylosporangium sucinum TaxID=1424081 RepID=A0A917TLI0_9ACTN|nr:hypothetical protein GCM10007977_030340 [Dactylosporangium sucinum]
MESFEGRCWLDWWANSSTLLGSVEVAVVIAVVDGGWRARGRILSDGPEEREAFDFLRALDPVFTLRFEDESTIPVAVHASADTVWFVMTEYAGPVQRAVSYEFGVT